MINSIHIIYIIKQEIIDHLMMNGQENNQDYWRQNMHPESILHSESEVTLEDLKASFLGENANLEEVLKCYSLDERRHLIIDRSSGEIIDSRNEDVVESMFRRTFTNQLQKMECSDLSQPSEKSMIGDPWEEHWKASDKIHQDLLAAICSNDFASFNKLLSRKQNHLPININYRSFDNWSPIHYAAMHGHLDILGLLLKESSLKLNSKTQFGWNALHVGVNSNKKDVCNMLIDAGIEINQQDQDLCTPLHYATQLGYKDIITSLIKAGADVKIMNHKGCTPRDLCTNQSVTELFSQEEEGEKDEGLFSSLLKNRKIQYVERLLNGSNRGPVEISPRKQDKKKQPVQSKSPDKREKEKEQHAKGHKSNIIKMYQLLKENKQMEPMTLSAFKFFKKIGEGAFGEVYVVRRGNREKLYALKAIKKEKVLKTNLYRYIQTEKEVLSLINHPFIVRLNYAFQTESYLFLVMDYCEGGDLGKLLQRKKKLDEATTKAYAAEIVLALEALHKNMIIYRDLKPENIVIDKDGHALLTDFGLSKKTTDLDAINKSFCGTPAYLPLEIIEKRGHNRMADWYEFGVVLYEMYVGIPPFYADNRAELYQNVKNGIIKFPKSTPELFRDIVKRLLHQDTEKRLGFENDAQSIKTHPWFSELNWDQVFERKLKVPPVEKKLQIGTDPIRCKFQDTKSEKYQIPSWSFIHPS